jgi:biopolymer transport protein ExbD
MRTSILARRRRRRIKKDFELQLTSMMDMLIILVVFLLKSYSTNAITFVTSPNIKLPNSTAEELPGDAINVVIDPLGIMVDNEKVLDFKNPPAPQPNPVGGPPIINSDQATYEIEPAFVGDAGRRILPLYDALMKAKDKASLLMSKAVWKDAQGKTIDQPKFQGTMIIHADRNVRYELLRKIMYTAGAAEYKVFKLVTVKKDAG